MSEVIVDLAGSNRSGQYSKPGPDILSFEAPPHRVMVEQRDSHQCSSLEGRPEGNGEVTIFHFADGHRRHSDPLG